MAPIANRSKAEEKCVKLLERWKAKHSNPKHRGRKRHQAFGSDVPRCLSSLTFFIGLFELQGSLLTKALPQVIVACGMSIMWKFIFRDYYEYELPTDVWAPLGTVTAFLVVFRTNLAYDRYYEGRKLLGQIVDAMSGCVRLTAAHVGVQRGSEDGKSGTTDVDVAELARNVNIMIAFIRQDLRESRLPPGQDTGRLFCHNKSWRAVFAGGGKHDPCRFWVDHDLFGAPSLKELLTENEITFYASLKPHERVLASSAELLKDFTQGCQDGHACDQFAQLISSATTGWRGCCRIIDCPMPFSYSHMLNLMLFLFAVVVAPILFAQMIQGESWLMVPSVAILNLIFYGMNELGVEIENPFGWQLNDHNLTRFCKVVRTETNMLVAWYKVGGADAAGATGAEACEKMDGLVREGEKVAAGPTADAKAK